MEIAHRNEKSLRTVSGLPSDDWYKTFKTHCEVHVKPIFLRESTCLSRQRAVNSTWFVISNFYDMLRARLTEINIVTDCIWNLEETVICVIPSSQQNSTFPALFFSLSGWARKGPPYTTMSKPKPLTQMIK
jgi:hypothetical protein